MTEASFFDPEESVTGTSRGNGMRGAKPIVESETSHHNNNNNINNNEARTMNQAELKCDEEDDEWMNCEACSSCENTQNLLTLKDNKEKLVVLTGMVMSSNLSLQDATRLYNTSSEMFACIEHVKIAHQLLSKLFDENSDYFLKKNTLLYEISVEIRRRSITLSSHRKHCKLVFAELLKPERTVTSARKKQRGVTRSSCRQTGDASYIRNTRNVSSLCCGICDSRDIFELRKVQNGNEKLMVLIGMVINHKISPIAARTQFELDSQFFSCNEHILNAQQRLSTTDCFNAYMHVQSVNPTDESIKTAWKCYQHFSAKYLNLTTEIEEEPDDGLYEHFTSVKRCGICHKGRIDGLLMTSTRDDYSRMFGTPRGKNLQFCSKHLKQNIPVNNTETKENLQLDESWNDVLIEHSYCQIPSNVPRKCLQVSSGHL